MKKIIAAFLSALVGVFGYTLTDTVVEERISKLEAEIVELRMESSDGNIDSFKIGDSVKIGSHSLDKLLFRENVNGELVFLNPYQQIDKVNEDDIFAHITDLTCKVIGYETFTYTVEKGKHYEPDMLVMNVPVFSLSYKGNISPSLAGKQIALSIGVGPLNIGYLPLLQLKEETTSYVSSDGSFEFNGEFSLQDLTPVSLSSETIYTMYGKEYAEKQFLDDIIDEYFSLGLVVYKAEII